VLAYKKLSTITLITLFIYLKEIRSMSWFNKLSSGAKRLAIGFATLASISVGNTINAAPAAAFTDGNFRIAVQADTSYVIDVAGNSLPANGGPVQIHKKTTEFQKKSSTWFGLYDSKAKSYEIHLTADPKLCLATAAGLNYNGMGEATKLVVTRDCANANNWLYVNGQITVSRKQEFCGDIEWGKIANYSKLQLIKCRAGNSAQQFVIEKNGGGSVNPGPMTPPPVVNVPQAPKTYPQYTINRYNTQVAGNDFSPVQLWKPIYDAVEWFRVQGELTDHEGFQQAWYLGNEKDISWNQAAAACDQLEQNNKGDFFLIWKNNKKTCGVIRPEKNLKIIL
jgi:hypothetical protein